MFQDFGASSFSFTMPITTGFHRTLPGGAWAGVLRAAGPSSAAETSSKAIRWRQGDRARGARGEWPDVLGGALRADFLARMR